MRKLLLLSLTAILTCFSLSSSVYADSQSGNPNNATISFLVGETLGEAYITAQYEGGIPATLKMGILKDSLRNRGRNCLSSLIGEIDSVVQRLMTARTNQHAMDIIIEFRHAALNRTWDLCGCEICQQCTEPPDTKMLYKVWRPPYGPGTLCLSREEAAARKAGGENVESLGKSCK